MSEVRVRFAPSPTGFLHMGGVRTALYNYLFAKKNGGKFILRIEDTDQARFVEGAEHYIEEALDWCGLTVDESPSKGGAFAPYKQSERRDIYNQYIAELLKTEHAYIAFDTAEELDAMRAKYEAEGKVFAYNQEARKVLKNSLALSSEEVEKLKQEGVLYVVRFKMPENRKMELSDIIRGTFVIDTNTLDDKVLVKADGMPTYHLANIIDDHTMEITHVIRGEEWLASMPLHELLYEAYGWQAPKFSHLPLILKPEGKGKLSKRDGDKLGFPVFPLAYVNPEDGKSVMGYREEGYFPEAFVNLLALLGWTPEGDKEIISLEEMVKEFALEKVHKAGAKFSADKAKWFNNQYLQQKPVADLLPAFQETLKNEGIALDNDKDAKIIALLRERANFVKDIYEQGKFFWKAPSEYNEKNFSKVAGVDTKKTMEDLQLVLSTIEFSEKTIDEVVHKFVEDSGLGFRKVMQPLRLALVGELKGPDIPVIMNILEKEEALSRVQTFINKLN